MSTESDSIPTQTRRRWQFTLRTFLVLVALVAALVWYGDHFWKLTNQADRHLGEVKQCQQMTNFWMSVSFFVPQEHWDANDDKLRWHSAKASECLTARWFPWKHVLDRDLPEASQGQSEWRILTIQR